MKTEPLPAKHASSGLKILLVVSLLVFTIIIPWLYTNPVPQDPLYHNFADQRSMFGIPHALNVLSNLVFPLVGILGVLLVWNHSEEISRREVMNLVFFTGIFFIGFGSGYYHWSPNNSTLVWDRLPMTVAFMTFTAIVVSERYSQTVGFRIFPWLLAMGIFSIYFWDSQNDLRPYIVIQFWPMMILPLVIWKFSGPGTRWLWLTIIFYASAKLLELADQQIFGVTNSLVSGHTLKHLAAGVGAFAMLAKVYTAGYCKRN